VFLLHEFGVTFPEILLSVCGETVLAVKEGEIEEFMVE
jgi:hypothetical protein